MNILNTIETAHQQGKKLLAILIDPDKTKLEEVKLICDRIHKEPIDFLLLGGSTVNQHQTHTIAKEFEKKIEIPMVLFPGDASHLTQHAQAVLYLNLISGNNPEYLIQQQIKAVPFLKNSTLEIISTGYVLLDGGSLTSTLRVTQTKPIAQENLDKIITTCLAGQYMGNKLLYLEAGSGASFPVKKHVVNAVHNSVNIPIIVGGGIRSLEKITELHNAGATLVVIGTAFENNNLF